jgi:hypothetical protein
MRWHNVVITLEKSRKRESKMQNDQVFCGFSPDKAGEELQLRTDLVMECHFCANIENCVRNVVYNNLRHQARQMMELLSETGREGEICEILRNVPKL